MKLQKITTIIKIQFNKYNKNKKKNNYHRNNSNKT